MQFKIVTTTDIAVLKEQAQILLVTATSVETGALHACLRPLNPSTQCLKMTAGNQTYYIGRLGGYGVIHVQCQMGSIMPGASESTVAEAINQWSVKAVVMVGIAFGLDRKNQRIGDILVSKTVIPYEIKRVGKTKVVHRSPIPASGSILLNRFSNGSDWRHNLPRDQKARIFPAQLLSGESLIDNEPYRARLLAAFPQAEGGEMEGAGVFAASHEKNTPWILVKGICDFADGHKNRGKRVNQIKAAESAASLCAHVFSKPGTFDGLGCTDLSSVHRSSRAGSMRLEEVLFEVYDSVHERAYLERTIDKDISALLGHQGVWISGPPGCGKTNALRRNLAVVGKTYEFIDLSRCVRLSVPELFQSLQWDLADRLGATCTNRTSSAIHSRRDLQIEQIAKLIEANVTKETHIIIDEVPLSGTDFVVFSEGIAAVIITLANRAFRKASFYLATICDPKTILPGFQVKLHERVRLLSMPVWSEAEMTLLMKQIAKLFPLHLTSSDKTRIVKTANGCPRSLKLMLKDWYIHRNTPGWSLDRVIAETPSQTS